MLVILIKSSSLKTYVIPYIIVASDICKELAQNASFVERSATVVVPIAD
jgi:hypothetical protein